MGPRSRRLIRRRGRAIIRRMDRVGSGCVLVAIAVGGCYAPSPPEGAPCSAAGDCPSGLVCDGTGRCTRTPGDAPGDGPGDGPVPDLVDPFSRPDGPSLGNGWIEKLPSTYALAGGEVVRVDTPESYRDNMVYRPASEDVRDVEVSIRVRFTAIPPGFAQVFVRADSATIAAPDSYDGYLLYIVGDVTDQAVLGRQRGSVFVTTLSKFSLSPPLDAGSTFRLTLRATGAQPVALRARVERLERGAWTPIGETAIEDFSTLQIAGAGTVGFSGHELATYVYDDFQRTPLGR